MTEREAIEILGELKKCYLGAIVNAIDMAIEAVKAQEPRVMTLEEVAALPDGSIVWLEDNDKPDVIVGLLRDVLLTANDHIVVVIHFATVRNQFLEVVTAMAEDYGIRWRCWTSRPDQATREATPWN